MQLIEQNELKAIDGGILPFIAAFAVTYTLLALIDSEDTAAGINAGNGNCK